MMTHLHPKLVRLDRLANVLSLGAGLDAELNLLQSDPGSGRMGGFGWMMQDIDGFSTAGNASLGSGHIDQIQKMTAAATQVAEKKV